MSDTISDEGFLLALLNSTPVVDGRATDELADEPRARAWLASLGGVGTREELRQVRAARQALQAVVRGEQPATALNPVLLGVTRVPTVADSEVIWTLEVPAGRRLAVRAVLAWDALARQRPGRLRACANEECRLFLIDRSTGNTARWCSMAACGNRMKARRHYQKIQDRSAG